MSPYKFFSLTNWWTYVLVLKMTIVKLSTLTNCLPQPDEIQSEIDTSSYIFLKTGSTFNGRSATTNLEASSATVAVLITLDNWSKWSLVEPEIQVNCGKRGQSFPDVVRPGVSEMIMFEKGPGFTGVCGVLTYRMEIPPEDPAHYLQVMWSIPYDLNTYNAYLAVGIANEFFNSSNLFNELYYHTGPFQRVKAGNLAEFGASDLKVKLRGTMQPDTYKPIVTVSIMPVEEGDSFKYADQNSAPLSNDPAYFVVISTLTVLSQMLLSL